MSSFGNCKFCHGRGCLACPGEKAKAEMQAQERRLNKNPLSEDGARLLKAICDATETKPAPVTPFRYENGIYADCPKCYGVGCVSCPEEAEAEYKRQFPDGPQPIATIKFDPSDPDAANREIDKVLSSILGSEAQNVQTTSHR